MWTRVSPVIARSVASSADALASPSSSSSSSDSSEPSTWSNSVKSWWRSYTSWRDNVDDNQLVSLLRHYAWRPLMTVMYLSHRRDLSMWGKSYSFEMRVVALLIIRLDRWRLLDPHDVYCLTLKNTAPTLYITIDPRYRPSRSTEAKGHCCTHYMYKHSHLSSMDSSQSGYPARCVRRFPSISCTPFPVPMSISHLLTHTHLWTSIQLYRYINNLLPKPYLNNNWQLYTFSSASQCSQVASGSSSSSTISLDGIANDIVS